MNWQSVTALVIVALIVGGIVPDWAVRTEADRKALAAGYYWDQDQAERVIRFAERYISPKFTAGEFRLFEWQRRTLMSLYGWRAPTAPGGGGGRSSTSRRRTARRCWSPIVAAYELLGGVADSPLVVSASTTKENAKQVYEQLATCYERHPSLKKATRRRPSSRRRSGTPGPAAASTGPSAPTRRTPRGERSAAIVDEAHAHRSPKLYRALEYSMIGRPDGFMVVISTAGDDLTHWYYALVERAPGDRRHRHRPDVLRRGVRGRTRRPTTSTTRRCGSG
jgi:phage terminase large subunit-like protein